MNLKTRNKVTIGLSGGILCGKSTALAAWKKAGAFVLSCDELVREISARPTMQRQLQTICHTTERTALAQKIFACTDTRKKIESILHPLVYAEIAKRLRASPAEIRVVEVPLLFEAGWEKYFDLTVAIVAPQKVLAARAKERHLKRADFLKRQKIQWPIQQKAAHADICIVNDGPTEYLRQKITALHRALCKIYDVK